eukprot:365366-Chlamydomonas_euryale.AAC.8
MGRPTTLRRARPSVTLQPTHHYLRGPGRGPRHSCCWLQQPKLASLSSGCSQQQFRPLPSER